jgi:hypothetical protein
MVQELLGHKTISVTARYAHLAPDYKLRALETLIPKGMESVQTGYKVATSTKNTSPRRKTRWHQVILIKRLILKAGE